MAIINTLITAKDNTSAVVKKVADNVRKASQDIQGSLDKASSSADHLEGSFEAFRNFDTSSLSGIVNSVRQITQQMDNAEASSAKFLIRIGALAGGSAALAYAVVSLVNGSNEYVKSLNEAATASNTTIERLQQMQSIFRSSGIEVEKFGDINKDVLDHLGDAFRDGSGPAEDMKAYGLNLQDFNKYLNQANGGIDAVVHAFYEMQKAGKSNAEIVNMMETLGSDSSHLVSTLKQYSTEQEALNAINSEHVGISTELAKQYQEYDNQIKTLSNTFQAWKANFLSPTVQELNSMLEILNGNWEGTNFTTWANKFMFNGDNIVSRGLRAMGGISDLDYDTQARRNLQSNANNALADSQALTNQSTPEGGWKNKEKEATEAAAAAKKAAAEAAAFKVKQDQAAKWIQQLDLNNASEQKKAELNYDIQLKQLDTFLSKKLISQQDYNHGVAAANAQLDTQNRAANEAKETASAERQRNLGMTSEYEYQERILTIKSEYLQRAIDAEYYTEMERLDYKHQAGLMKEEEYQNQLAAIKGKHDYDTKNNQQDFGANLQNVEYKKQADSLQSYANTMSSAMNIAQTLGDTITSSAEEGSAAWIAATVATKGMAVAQAIIMANLAAAQVMASPASLTLAQKVAESNIIRTMGYASAAMIAAQGIAQIAGAREKGGQVQAGSTYLVGEKGPELFTAGATGNITPNNKLTGNGGGGNTFTQENHFHSSGISSQDAEMIKQMTSSMFDQKMREEKRYGGMLSGG